MIVAISMKNLIPIFKSFGLLESEIKTYLGALELGPCTVLQLSKKTELSRQATYTAIESLTAQGLMSVVEKGKKTYYASESPERLRSVAEEKLKRMEAAVREIKSITQELKLIQKGEKPIVKIHEGREGLHLMLQDIIHSKTDAIFEFTNERAVNQLFSPEDLKPLGEKLDRLRIPTNFLSIHPDTEDAPREQTRYKTITRKDIDFNGDLTIYGNKVALSTLKGKLVSIIIESKEIAEMLRNLFKLAWEAEHKK